MRDRGCDWNINHALPAKPPLVFAPLEESVVCGCGVTFIRRCKAKKRCDECRARVTKELMARNSRKQEAKRRAAAQQKRESVAARSRRGPYLPGA